MPKSFKLANNLTILGPPGSGKGFYGRPLAEFLDVPLFTASKVLRKQRPHLNLSSGDLIDCSTVSETLLDFFKECSTKHYIVDGFPRTLRQIRIMEEEWPIQHQVHFAVQLNVPDKVCEQKMLGRRKCTKCNKEINVANVQMEGFDLPPQLPTPCCPYEDCDPDRDWAKRDDDTPDIVRERLFTYRTHEEPILDFYERQGRLLRFTPYLGEKDVPKLEYSVEHWLKDFEKETRKM